MIATQTWSDMIMYLQSSRWSSLRMCQGRIHCGIWGPELSSVFFWGSCETVRRTLRLWQSQLIICKKDVIEVSALFLYYLFFCTFITCKIIIIPEYVCKLKKIDKINPGKRQKHPWYVHFLLLNDFELYFFYARRLEYFMQVHMEGSSKQIVRFWQLLQQSLPPLAAPAWKWIIWSHFNCLCDS